MSRWPKIIIIIIAVIIAIVLLAPRIIGYLVQGPRQEQGETDLRFTEIKTDFIHTSDFVAALPFMALSTIDVVYQRYQ